MFVSLQFILSIRAPLEEQTGGLNNALVKNTTPNTYKRNPQTRRTISNQKSMLDPKQQRYFTTKM